MSHISSSLRRIPPPPVIGGEACDNPELEGVRAFGAAETVFDGGEVYDDPELERVARMRGVRGVKTQSGKLCSFCKVLPIL